MKRVTTEQARAEIRGMGLEPAFGEFPGVHSPIQVLHEGKLYRTDLTNLRAGKRPWRAVQRTDHLALTRDMAAKGYSWEPVPVSAHTKIAVKTPSGGEWTTTPNMWRRGLREPRTKDAKFYIRQMRAEGYKLVDVPRLVTEPFLAISPEGREWLTTLNKWSQGRRFTGCNHRVSHNDMEERLAGMSIRWISGEYTNQRSILFLECTRCKHRWNRAGAHLTNGCPACAKRYDGAESELGRILSGMGGEPSSKFYFPKGPGPGGRQEIDIYFPSRRVGVEYCGLHWHSEAGTGDPLAARNRHRDKTLLAESLGIRLVTVFEDEWLRRRPQVEGYLRSLLGANPSRAGARQCELRGVPKPEARAFLEAHHIQGPARHSKVFFGLYHGPDLLGVISGGPHHRGAEGALVLDRLCFASGWTVAGGASRLFSALGSWARSNGYSKVLSWSDNRWSQGGVYRALGFGLDGELGPDYSYVLGKRRVSKQSLKKTAADRATGLTERELRLSQGYDRIWDCGKRRWVLDLWGRYSILGKLEKGEE